MKYRKLRIAWSVAWGIVAVLLCVLWVRSYWNRTDWPSPLWESGNIAIYSTHGSVLVARALVLHWGNGQTTSRFQTLDVGISIVRPHINWTGFHFEYRSWTLWTAQAPYWFLTALAGVSTALLWVKRITCRFSLRALLVATTLVAVVLGMIVWLG